MRTQAEAALGEADVVLCLFDARAGVTPLDKTIAQWLRVQPRPVILVANKVAGRATSEAGLSESYELRLDETVALSAAHGEGMVALYAALRPYIDAFVEACQLEAAEYVEGEGNADWHMTPPPIVRTHTGKATPK